MEATAPTGSDSSVEARPSRRVRRSLSAVGQRLGLVPEPPGENVYHGFISYSHQADAALALALQRGLHRFAKPWYQARALHVFRDEAALSANPDLWSSVRQALDRSQYYILLASPEAARSQWVSREAQYWLDEKEGLDRVLIGLTEGELSFEGGAVAPEQNALPPPLQEAFKREPRYIDLRWAKSAKDLSLSHPRFRDAVAEIASPLHGKPKEEISSEEVKQHRRTRRVARAAVLSLVTLLAAAIVAAIVAYSQYESAHARSLAAQATAELSSDPEHSVALALQSTQISASGTDVSSLRQALALSPLRMVINSGAGSSAQAAWNPRLDQIAVSGPDDTAGLWNPRTGKLERTLHGPDHQTPRRYPTNGSLLYSPDGAWIAYVDERGVVSVWNARTGALTPGGQLESAIALAKTESLPHTTILWRDRDQLLVSGTGLDRVLAYTPSSGDVTTLARLPGDEALMSLSPDGSKLFLGYANGPPEGGGGILNLQSGGFIALSGWKGFYAGLGGHEACWLPGGQTVITWDPTEAQDLHLRYWNTDTGRETAAVPVTGPTVNAAACGGTAKQQWFATGDYGGHGTLRIIGGLDYGLTGHSQIINSVTASPSGAYLATASADGTARVWRATDGTLVRLLSDGSPVNSIHLSPDSGLALTTDQQGLVKIWDVGIGEPSTVLASAGPGQTYPLGFIRSGSAVWGLTTGLASGVHLLATASLVTWNSSTGAVIREVRLPANINAAKVPCTPALQAVEYCNLTPPPNLITRIPTGAYLTDVDVAVAVSADGNLIAYAQPGAVSVLDAEGHVVTRIPVSSPVTGLEFARGGDVLLAVSNRSLRIWRQRTGTVTIPQASPPIDAELSRDGSTVATAGVAGQVGVWSSSSGHPLALLRPAAIVKPAFAAGADRLPLPLRVALSPDGSIVAAGTTWQTVSIWKVAGHRLIAARLVTTPSASQKRSGDETQWPIDELSFSDDGSRLLAVDYPQIGAGDSLPPGTATLFDSRSGQIVDAFQSPGPLGAAVSPGMALSPNGDYVFGGAVGFSPTPPGGIQAVYPVKGHGTPALDLENAGLAPFASPQDDPVPADPWSPDGLHLLVGSRGVYACDACGSVPQLQGAAERRTGWSHPLSAADDLVPRGGPLG
jgi:WD40 repeat protein